MSNNLGEKLTKIIPKSIKLYEEIYKSEICIEMDILAETLEKFNQSLKDIKDPNVYKQAGYLTFYIRKLKPFNFVFNREKPSRYLPTLFLNELLAVDIGYGLIYLDKIKSKSYIKLKYNFKLNLIRTLRYNSYSPQALTMIYESIYLV